MNRWRPLTLLLTCLAVPAIAAMPGPSEDVRRHALIVSEETSGASATLANLLEIRFGFEVYFLGGANLGLREIEDVLYAMAEEVGPFDPVFVHISLPVNRNPRLNYLPPDAAVENRWEHLNWDLLSRWLVNVPTGPLLLTYPGCSAEFNRRKSSTFGDESLEILSFEMVKRPAPAELLVVCDTEAIRTQRRDPESVFVPWRGERVAELILEAITLPLGAAAAGAPERYSLSGRQLASRLSSIEGNGLEWGYLTLPTHQAGQFRLVPLRAGNTYEDSYAAATHFEQLRTIQRDYQEASLSDPTLKNDFVAFSRSVALAENAMASGAPELDEKARLTLRRYAVGALRVRRDDPQARDAMVAVVNGATDSGIIRRAALTGITMRGESVSPREQQALVDAMQDTDVFVREAAYVGLAQIGDVDRLLAALQTEQEPRLRATVLSMMVGLARSEDAALLSRFLRDSDPSVRLHAVGALSSLQPTDAINTALLGALERERESRVRSTIAYSLGTVYTEANAEANVSALIEMLRVDPSTEVRVAAIDSLGTLQGPRAIDALIDVLKSPEPDRVKVVAVEALGRLQAEQAVQVLAEIDEDDSVAFRVAAAEALAAIGTFEAADILWGLLEADPDPRVAEAARRGLEWLPPNRDSIETRLSSSSVAVREAAVVQLSNSEEPFAVELQLDALGDRDAGVQRLSIEGLANRDLSEASAQVRDAYDSGSRQVKVNLIGALGRVPDNGVPWAVEPLGQAAGSDDPVVSAAAVRALANQGSAESLPTILNASGSRSDLVRAAAADALASFNDPEALERLQMMALNDENADVRDVAVRSLSQRYEFTPNNRQMQLIEKRK